jgi:hypothetical protein
MEIRDSLGTFIEMDDSFNQSTSKAMARILDLKVGLPKHIDVEIGC